MLKAVVIGKTCNEIGLVKVNAAQIRVFCKVHAEMAGNGGAAAIAKNEYFIPFSVNNFQQIGNFC